MCLLAKTTYDKHRVVRRVSREAVDRRLQVLLVASEVDEGDDLAGVVANLFGRLALGVVHWTALRVEAQDLVRYRRRPAYKELLAAFMALI